MYSGSTIIFLIPQTVVWIILVCQRWIWVNTENRIICLSFIHFAFSRQKFFFASEIIAACIRKCNGYSFQWVISSLWWVTSFLVYFRRIASCECGRNYDVPLLLAWQSTAVFFSLSLCLSVASVDTFIKVDFSS